MNVRAAKTALYRGVYYRSRLEACWSAFFHRHHIRVEYEQRWCKFADGTSYQPDFWLPDSKAWFEVKGELTEEDRHKVLSLARAASYRGELVLMGGAPAGYLFGEVTPSGQWNLNSSFGRCSHCDVWTVAMFGCRQCGYAETDPRRDTYIDYHDSFSLQGCKSARWTINSEHPRCNGAFVWDGNGPRIELAANHQLNQFEYWANESMGALSGFEIIPKKYPRSDEQ